jgi:hypothetical protein
MFSKDTDPARSVINGHPRSGSGIQDYGSSDPEEIFMDLQHWLQVCNLSTLTVGHNVRLSRICCIKESFFSVHMYECAGGENAE